MSHRTQDLDLSTEALAANLLMASPSPSAAVHRRESWWAFMPSWLLSLAIHASLVVPLALVLQPDPPKGPGAEIARSVGIVSESPAAVSASNPENSDNSEQDSTPEAESTAEPIDLGGGPPVPLQLPVAPAQPSRLGPGPLLPPSALPTGRDLMKPGRNASPVGIGAVRKPGGEFFGVKAEGSVFVYVIDASGSMSEHSAFAVAKAELLASLQQLDSNQQFQVIFYNDDAYPWNREGSRQQLYFATDINKNLVAQFARNFSCRGGTRHMAALELALRFNPEVIFFLTDAREPELSAGEIDKIARRCASRTTIHTIEFGIGEPIRTTNFLKKLALATGGQSGYRDVQKFD